MSPMSHLDYTAPAAHRHDDGCEDRYGEIACGYEKEMSPMKTCTYGPMATTGAPCGKPAVTTFGTFAECAEHATTVTAPTPALIAGGTAGLLIHGFYKTVEIVELYRTRALVLVPTAHGPVERLVPITELEA